LPRDSASCAIRPGTLFRAVKLLPMNKTFIGDGSERLIMFAVHPDSNKGRPAPLQKTL